MGAPPKAGIRKRRGKNTRATHRAILQKIRDGLPTVYACVAGGVCKQTWFRWVKEDPKLKAEADFASAQAVEAAFADIKRAGEGDKDRKIPPIWQARAWYLERCHGFVAVLDVRQSMFEGEDVEFKVQFADGTPMPALADAEEEAA